jgi:protein ImuA
MIPADSLLKSTSLQTGAGLPVLDNTPDLRLRYGRVHEACGTARHRFALWIVAQTSGPVLWIGPAWGTDRLNACGLAEVIDPARLVFVSPRRAEDVLWSMEESLRSGAVALAVGDVPGLPGLTHVRRMHLAAETGGQGRRAAPIGLLLTPGQGGAQGVESRWSLDPAHGPKGTAWQLERLRARTAPRKSWRIAHRPDTTGPRLESAA